MRKLSLATVFLLTFFHSLTAQNAEIVVVRPQEIDDLLVNPGTGFNTSLFLNHNPGSDSSFRFSERPLEKNEYPETSMTYLRFDWRFLEPERGRYNWYIIDEGLKLAASRGQTLLLRIAPYGDRPGSDIPDWLRAMIGESKNLAHSFWRLDPEDARYIENFTAMVRALGARYDGHPDLEFVDVSIVGFWGEGAGSALLTDQTRRALVDAYLETFKKTPLVMLLTDEKTNKYGISPKDVGWRVDCLGDLDFWAKEQNGWTHMFDYYPQGIINFGMKDAWKKAPVALEVCGSIGSWKERRHYTAEQVKYIFDQALKWHVSAVNAKSSAVPEEWWPLVNDWLKKIGYRLVLRKFTYPSVVRPHGKLAFTTWWENKGVAPCYRRFPFAIRLKNANRTEVMLTDADIREWLPGDNLYDDAVFLPLGMPEGEYDIEVAILDQRTLNPKVKLAIAGKGPDGWYRMGKITVKESLK